ncbi:MAG: VWA domain-containing protein [Candidatus Acidiferrales bacterium]
MGTFKRELPESVSLTIVSGLLLAGLAGIIGNARGAARQSSTPSPPPASAPAPSTQSGDQKPTASVAPPGGPSSDEKEEMTSEETVPAFRVRVNLVLVRVTVRDQFGKVVGNLHKEDFRLFDNRKPQTITQFSLEPAAAESAGSAKTARSNDSEGGSAPVQAALPRRYLGLYFDDVHMRLGDLQRVRDAAGRFLNSSLQADDRAGIFTASGQGNLDFTDDRAKLHEALERLFPHPIVVQNDQDCPDVDHLQGYKILFENDAVALNTAATEALHCFFQDDPRFAQQAAARATNQAGMALSAGETQADYTTRGIDGLIRRMSILPGQRNLVLVSPGFLVLGRERIEWDLIDRALHDDVIVNSLDARGLDAPIPGGEIDEQRPLAPRAEGPKALLRVETHSRNSSVLSDLAYGTGGLFFQNSNDLDQGFKTLGGLPELSYLLGFVPADEKYDGRFHTIDVKLASRSKLAVQARRGYYAPDKRLDAAAQAKQDIEEALFSRQDFNEVPVEVHTQFFKVAETNARLSVVTKVDTRFVPFRKAEGRNLDKVTVVTALFDRDGKYIIAKEKTVEMRLLDATRERMARSGLTTKTIFDVQPGTYLVRLVVRDSEGSRISAQNRTVEIP